MTRALFLGMDDPLVGLYHGKHYEIEIKTLKNGKYVITVADLMGLKMRYSSRREFMYDWAVKK